MKDILDELIIQDITLEGKQSKKAEKLIEVLFKDKYDKSGELYIDHLYSVANNFNDEERYTVGLLHDTLEDTLITYNDLALLGIRESYLKSIDLLTRKDNMSYDDYIDLIIESNNSVVLDVKLADLKNNMLESRLEKLDRSTRERLINKYNKAYDKIVKRREEIK